MKPPYSSAPKSSFWSRSVSRGWQPADMLEKTDTLIRQGDLVVTAGSCFASNLVPFLEKSGHTYLRTEVSNPSLLNEETYGYEKFSAGYGNIYTARQMLQLLRRALGKFQPKEDRWYMGDEVIDPFRPGLKYPARSDAEFDALTAQHLACTLEAMTKADILIFTLGLTEAWISREDGAVFPACPGTVGGEFDPKKHKFKNFTASEVAADLRELFSELREINPAVRVILTVSPVPLVATASDEHVLEATIYSKSVLRVAAEEVSRELKNVTYFPSYEIVTGPQAPHDFFMPDRRNVSEAAVATVMAAFLSKCENSAPNDVAPPAPAPAEDAQAASRSLIEAECEEMMADRVSA